MKQTRSLPPSTLADLASVRFFAQFQRLNDCAEDILNVCANLSVQRAAKRARHLHGIARSHFRLSNLPAYSWSQSGDLFPADADARKEVDLCLALLFEGYGDLINAGKNLLRQMRLADSAANQRDMVCLSYWLATFQLEQDSILAQMRGRLY